MSIRLGVVMDPISEIKPYKDTTLAMLLEAQRRGWSLHYMEMKDISVRDGIAFGNSRTLTVTDSTEHWHEFTSAPKNQPLSDLDVILMRKDPPFDTEYIYATYALELAELAGTLIVNKPSSLRDANEKFFAQYFPQCCAPTIISSDMTQLREFHHEHQDIILKPLDGMGGDSIFRMKKDDPNISVILECMTNHGKYYAMAQRYVPEISAGDKRILMIDGEPFPHALARIPAKGETRGNLAAGGRGEAVDLSERDRWICQQTGPALRDKGLLFVGLDVIGDYLTEINVTSPTCVRELDSHYDANIAGLLMDAIEKRLN